MKKLAKWLLIVTAFLVALWLIVLTNGCGTLTGLQSDIHQVTRPTTMERGQ